jgi:hypothetical protein
MGLRSPPSTRTGTCCSVRRAGRPIARSSRPHTARLRRCETAPGLGRDRGGEAPALRQHALRREPRPEQSCVPTNRSAMAPRGSVVGRTELRCLTGNTSGRCRTSPSVRSPPTREPATKETCAGAADDFLLSAGHTRRRGRGHARSPSSSRGATTSCSERPARSSGSPRCGRQRKTTTALLRLKRLCQVRLALRERQEDTDPVRVLVLTYNRSLAGYISALAREQVPADAGLDPHREHLRPSGRRTRWGRAR